MKLPLSPRARQAFVDASAFFPLADADDNNHPAAQEIAAGLIANHWRLFTTNFILAETHALLLARLGSSVALGVLQEIDHSATTIVRTRPADERRAREILAQYDDKDFSLTDAISFAVMERLRITHAFTFDRHFAQYGFNVLAPGQF